MADATEGEAAQNPRVGFALNNATSPNEPVGADGGNSLVEQAKPTTAAAEDSGMTRPADAQAALPPGEEKRRRSVVSAESPPGAIKVRA